MVEIKAYIYYHNLNSDPDRSFERAAHWAADEADPRFIIEYIGVKTRNDFINAWNGILAQATRNNAKVQSVNILSHASKGSEIDGLEFADGGGGGTLSRTDLENLPKLPWTQFAFLTLSGCNTGLEEERSWAPAKTLALAQDVTGFGEKGFTYFSRNPDSYVPQQPNNREIYLMAYRRGRNAPTGDGRRIPAAIFNSPFLSPQDTSNIPKSITEEGFLNYIENTKTGNMLLQKDQASTVARITNQDLGDFKNIRTSRFKHLTVDFGRSTDFATIYADYEQAIVQIDRVPVFIATAILNATFSGREVLISWTQTGEFGRFQNAVISSC